MKLVRGYIALTFSENQFLTLISRLDPAKDYSEAREWFRNINLLIIRECVLPVLVAEGEEICSIYPAQFETYMYASVKDAYNL